MNKRKFVMYDPDEGSYKTIPTNDIVSAIYYAWNYEFEVFEGDSKNLIFTPFDGNKFNSDNLSEYGLRIIDHEEYRNRVLQCINTGKIYKPSCQEVN